MGEQSRLRMIGFRRIDALIEQHGTDEDGKPIDGEREFVETILAMVVEGDSLEVIARRFDVAYGSLWRWISGDKNRMAEYESALRGHADKLVHETKEIADKSEDPKLMIDTRKFLSGKWDAGRFGDKNVHSGGGGITVILAQTLADGGIKTVEGHVIEQRPLVNNNGPVPVLKTFDEDNDG